MEWMLIPLNGADERNERSVMTKLLVFEPPMPVATIDWSGYSEGHGEKGDRC